MIFELIKNIPFSLSKQRAQLKPGRPEERHQIQCSNKCLLCLLLFVPFFVNDAQKVAIQGTQVFCFEKLFQFLLDFFQRLVYDSRAINFVRSSSCLKDLFFFLLLAYKEQGIIPHEETVLNQSSVAVLLQNSNILSQWLQDVSALAIFPQIKQTSGQVQCVLHVARFFVEYFTERACRRVTL